MSTSAKTVTRIKYIRSWLDLDPKFLGALAVLIGTIVIAGVLVATGSITIETAAAEIGPVFLAAAAAYVATSSHRSVIEDAIAHAGQVLQDSAPIVKQLAPDAAPAVEAARDDVAAIQAQLAAADTSVARATPSLAQP